MARPCACRLFTRSEKALLESEYLIGKMAICLERSPKAPYLIPGPLPSPIPTPPHALRSLACAGAIGGGTTPGEMSTEWREKVAVTGVFLPGRLRGSHLGGYLIGDLQTETHGG